VKTNIVNVKIALVIRVNVQKMNLAGVNKKV